MNMNIEELFSRYQRSIALDYARQMYNESDDDMKACLKKLFPELVKSRNEQIAGAILDALRSNKTSISSLMLNGFSIEAVKEWLDEQKGCPSRREVIDEIKKSYNRGRESALKSTTSMDICSDTSWAEVEKFILSNAEKGSTIYISNTDSGALSAPEFLI